MSASDSYIANLLEEVNEFLQPYIDIRDGEDGQQLPNKAMSLSLDIEDALRKMKRADATEERR